MEWISLNHIIMYKSVIFRKERVKKSEEMFSEEVKLRVRFSLGNLRLDDDVLNIPLFMVDYADELIGMAMKQH